jgi:hypothetical protein
VNSTFHLVYQAGIANVFKETDGQRVRVLQHAFEACEWFCHGVIATGATVKIWHANVAGDIALADWTPGPGGPFADRQRPPVGAR